MKFIVRGRQGGKTTELLSWMLEAEQGEPRVCVAHSEQRAMQLLRDSRERELGLESWQFVSVREVQQGGGGLWAAVPGRRGIRVGVDDLDLSLPRLLGSHWPVDVVTATGELG